ARSKLLITWWVGRECASRHSRRSPPPCSRKSFVANPRQKNGPRLRGRLRSVQQSRARRLLSCAEQRWSLPPATRGGRARSNVPVRRFWRECDSSLERRSSPPLKLLLARRTPDLKVGLTGYTYA